MMTRWMIMIALALSAMMGLAGCARQANHSHAPSAAPPVADSADEVQPLGTGQAAPTGVLRTVDDEPADMAAVYRRQPTMLLFYRGGWCPFCNQQLGQLAQAEKAITDLGYQIIAVSPDRPPKLQETRTEGEYSYRLLSDSDMQFARSFGLAFRVPDATVQQYRGYGIDLDEASGHAHHLLPVPAVYLIDRDGIIRFAHWNPDYKDRLSAEALVDAARSAAR